MLRWLTAGESHGEALVGVLEGLPAGVATSRADVAEALARRRLGFGRGARMKFERDEVDFLGGVRHGLTIGGPVAIRVGNTEWPKWREIMAVDPVDEDGRRYDEPGRFDDQARAAALTRPRPGHADLAGMQKYDFDEVRPILERASARETAARVAIASVARAFLSQALGVELVSHVVRTGSVALADGIYPLPADESRLDEDPMRCVDPDTSARMVAEIEAAKHDGDTLGGVVEVLAYGLPPGLGSHVHADRRLDARLAAALMGIQAIKGVEVGEGFESAAKRGSLAHDEIELTGGGDGDPLAVRRMSARAGGIEGGMTTGEPMRVRAALKPISSLPRALSTVDTSTGEAATAINQRSDTCAVVPATVVAEHMVALVLAEAALEKFGGDSVGETSRNLRSYLDNLKVTVAE